MKKDMPDKPLLETLMERIGDIRNNACLAFFRANDVISEERKNAAASLGIKYIVVKAEDYMKIPGADIAGGNKDFIITDGGFLSALGYDVDPLMKVLAFRRDEFDEILKYVRQFTSGLP